MATEEPELPITYRELGKGELLADGEDLIIIALGHMTLTAMQVRDMLLKEGISAAVLDPVFVKPLDTEMLCKLLIDHQRIVTLEEHSVVSGLGSIVNNYLMSQGFSNIQMLNLGIPETFVDHGSHADLMQEIGLSPKKIVERIQKYFSFKKELERQEHTLIQR
jgi:1-deoxy-D-xylulose-5-phosphate synthase